jgi:hypothetical protein
LLIPDTLIDPWDDPDELEVVVPEPEPEDELEWLDPPHAARTIGSTARTAR